MCARVHFIYRCCHYVEPREEDFPTWVWVEFCPGFDPDSNSCNSLWYETGSIAIDDICEDCKEAMRQEDVRLRALQSREREQKKRERSVDVVGEKAAAGKVEFEVQVRSKTAS
jgi:hypothetical protein